MKKLLWIPLGAIAFFAGWLVVGYYSRGASLTLENRSEEIITDLHVTVYGQEFVLGALRPNERRKVKVTRYSDSGWRTQGKWPDGKVFDRNLGYITHGSNYSDKVRIDGRERFRYENHMWFFFPPL